MRSLPRLALATPPSGPEPGTASLALLAGLHARGWKVQHFRSWACPVTHQVFGPITGLPGRHLDAWLMPPAICADVFARGARSVNLAVVEGTLGQPAAAPEPDFSRLRDYTQRPGPLSPLADMLDLPRVAVVDCRGWTDPHLPCVPPGVDAVILDGLERPDLFSTFRSLTRHLLHIPVLGAIDALPALRAELAELPLALPVPDTLLSTLALSFLKYADLDAIANLATRPFDPHPAALDFDDAHLAPTRRPAHRVAYAMDEAFGGYYPDTLEALELLGAELVEFSPLRDGSLPAHVDLVMFGCGFPDHYAAELSANHSLLLELRARACRGLRIYAEGGGAAYLGHSMIVDGRAYGGAGILPFDAELRPEPLWPEPVERTIARDGWLGPAGTPLRGYAANRWLRHPAPEDQDCPRRSGPLTPEADLVFRSNAVGSFIHLHLPSLPDVVHAFTGPCRSNTAHRFPS